MGASFRTDLMHHLASYKREVLGIAEHGFSKRWNRFYEHILPIHLQQLNILPSLREPLWCWFNEQRPRLKLHHDFHHLNSSQAFAFNLFFPAISNLDAGLLLKLFGVEGQIDQFCVEKVVDLNERTNFDAFLRLKSKACCFFEVKLTENEFGGCKNDDAHRTKLQQIYTKRLTGSIPESCFEPKFFFKHYQLLRNISYICDDQQNRLFLIFPRANEKLAYASNWLVEHVADSIRERIRIVYVEDLVSALRKESSAIYWRELSDKYLLRNEMVPGHASSSLYETRTIGRTNAD